MQLWHPGPWNPNPTPTFATRSLLARGGLIMADHGLGNMPGSEDECCGGRDVTEWSQTGCEYPQSGGQSGGRSGPDISHKRDFLGVQLRTSKHIKLDISGSRIF